jgi:putative flippase GtrA
MIKFIKKHWEVLSYLIFGVLTTLLNIVLYALFNKLFGYTAANSWGNVLDNILCILFAYATNRAFVFRSKTRGREMAKEFGAFVTCRLGTLVLDAVIMMVGGNLLAAQGAALMDGMVQGLLNVVAGWISPENAASIIGSYTGTPMGSPDGSAAIAIIGGADGPTAIFVTSRYNAQTLWGLAVKIFSNVIVVVLNYVFSKLIIFKKKK